VDDALLIPYQLESAISQHVIKMLRDGHARGCKLKVMVRNSAYLPTSHNTKSLRMNVSWLSIAD